ncbi:MAG: hypothetical protein PWR10_2280 [Halanaerobiales bacterium]|nr:hypothetical protein [Halanaerobiales bacterium]
MNGAERYFDKIKNLIEWLEETQLDKVKEASDILTDAIVDKRTIWAIGCTHSAALTAEVYYRAGGLMLINGIFPSGMWLNEVPVTKTSKIENISGYAEIIFEEHNIKPNDVLLIFSTAGRNNFPVEMALEAKKRDVFVIAITSLKYSRNVESRHKSGKRLFEIADLVLDNGADKGDAVIKFDNLKQKVGPVSTVSGALLLNAIVTQTVGNLLDKGITPPVYMSGNLDGGESHNKKMLKEYKDVIKYMPYL